MHRRALTAALAFALVGGLCTVAVGQPAGPSTDPAAAPAGQYAMDKNHASLIARIKHFGLSNFAIRFDDIDGSFTFDPKAPLSSKVEATVDVNSFDVGKQQLKPDMTLNNHFIIERNILGNKDHPKVTFVSTAITKGAGATGKMTGDLTMNGVTKPVTLDVTFNGTAPGQGGSPQRMGFSASGVVKRSEFGVATWAPAAVLSEEVTVQIEAEFTKKP